MNMLKTLYGSIHSKEAIAQLDALGISVYKIGEDGSKQFRKAQDVLLDLSVTAQGSKQSMEEVYKSISGGKFQWSKAGATLGDYKEFIRTWGQAVNSMGFTDKQVGMQLDTISRRLGTLKADLMSMNVSAGKNGLTTVIKDTITFVDRFIVGLFLPADTFILIRSALSVPKRRLMVSSCIPTCLSVKPIEFTACPHVRMNSL
jgi:hypothetical protein